MQYIILSIVSTDFMVLSLTLEVIGKLTLMMLFNIPLALCHRYNRSRETLFLVETHAFYPTKQVIKCREFEKVVVKVYLFGNRTVMDDNNG